MNTAEQEYAAQESRLRRMATRQGLQLCKSRVRNFRVPEWSTYMIADENNWIVAQGLHGGYGMSLADVENYLIAA